MSNKFLLFSSFIFSDKDGKIILADEFSPDNCRLWDAQGHHMDKDVFRRGLGELTDVYEVVWEKLQELK